VVDADWADKLKAQLGNEAGMKSYLGLFSTSLEMDEKNDSLHQSYLAALKLEEAEDKSFAEKAKSGEKRWNWCDSSSEEESEDDKNLLALMGLGTPGGEGNEIHLPTDLDKEFPMMFRAFVKLAKAFELKLVYDRNSMSKSGLKCKSFFADPKEDSFRNLDEDDKVGVNTLLSLVTYSMYRPSDSVKHQNRHVLVAGWYLQGLLFTDNKEDDSKIKRVLRQSDGGRANIIYRLKRLFALDVATAEVIFNAFDKVRRSITKNCSKEEKQLLRKAILSLVMTSPEGVAQSFYKTVTKTVIKKSDPKKDGFGKNKGRPQQQETEKRTGYLVPSFHSGDDMYMALETTELKKYEQAFVPALYVKGAVKHFDLADPASIVKMVDNIEMIVNRCYRVSEALDRIRSERKRLTRSLGNSEKGEDGKLTQAIWIKAKKACMEQCNPITEEFYTWIRSEMEALSSWFTKKPVDVKEESEEEDPLSANN
jgi:hypothetical protein